MSPEQAAGEQRARRPERHLLRSAACCTRCSRASRRSPGRPRRPCIAKRLTGSAPPLLSRRADVPGPVAGAVARALAPDPLARFPTAVRLRQRTRRRGEPAAPAASATVPTVTGASVARSIAVLPFSDMSAEPRPGIPRRWHRRGDHQRTHQGRCAARGRTHIVLRLQGATGGCGTDRAPTQGDHDSRRECPEGGQPPARDGTARQRRGWLSALVRALRPGAGGRVRRAGRDRRQRRERAVGRHRGAGRSRTGTGAAAHRERAGLRVLPSGAAALPPVPQEADPASSSNVRAGHRARPTLRAGVRRSGGLQLDPVHVLRSKRAQPRSRRTPPAIGRSSSGRTWRRPMPRAGSR